MKSHLLMTLQVAVAAPQKIGVVPHGTRATAPITSGTFEGPRLRGKVLPGGGDWTPHPGAKMAAIRRGTTSARCRALRRRRRSTRS
jgi:hypothetical protein